jgi:hypothetical protein
MLERSAAALGSMLLLTGALGCTAFSAPVVPPPGLLYSNTKAPIDIDSDQTQLGAKRGAAVSKTVLGLVSWGDASVREAATSGGLTTIRHVDYEYYNVLGIYSTFTTVVYGD